MSSPTDPCRRPVFTYSDFPTNGARSIRKLSTLQPPPYPLPGPNDMQINVHIPMSPPPQHGTLPPPLRPLVLPSPPATPAFLRFPAPPSSDICNTRRMDNMPMFRFSDLYDVNEGVIVQSCNGFESSGTPIYVPYSITQLLEEEPVTPDWKQEMVDGTSESDMDVDDIPPNLRVTGPSPKITYGGRQPPPPITIIDATLHRHDHPGSGSCEVDTSPMPSSTAIPADWRTLPALACSLTRNTATPLDAGSEHAPFHNRHADGPISCDASLTGRSSSVTTTDTSVSPHTSMPSRSGQTNQKPRRRRQSIYRGWWSVSSAEPDEHVAPKRRESRFREEMDICAPEGYFERGGSGYEGGDEQDD